MIEQRKTKRFDLDLPVEIVRSGPDRVSRLGRIRNISSGGVLFVSPSKMEIGGPVEYLVTLTTGTGGAVSLRCMGKVLRLEPSIGVTEGFAVAVSLERYEFLRSNGHAAA